MDRITCPLCGELAEHKLDNFEFGETEYVHLIKHDGRWTNKKCIQVSATASPRPRWQEGPAPKTRYTESFKDQQEK